MKTRLLLALALTQPLAALTIRIDYTYDTTNFFDTQAKRDAVEAVAKFYGDLIQDNLLRIDAAEFPGCSWTANPRHPATGATLSISNLVVPEDTIIVYVGARDLGGSTLGLAGPGGWGGSSVNAGWFPLLRGRGNAGAAYSNASLNTDFALWGGSMAFDIDTTWNFSQTRNLAGVDFIKIALHEMGHVLGIGTADSWDNLISAGSFTGAATTHSHGSQPPIQSGNGHFDGVSLVSPAFGSFGMIHGNSRPVLMLPSSGDDGVNLDVVSDLDLAALVDIGWEIAPPHSLKATALGPAGAAFTWSSSSFFDYKVERGTNLQTFLSGSATINGDGSTKSWTDPAPPTTAAFYRLAATKAFPQPQNIPAPAQAPSPSRALSAPLVSTSSQKPRFVEGCGGNGQ